MKVYQVNTITSLDAQAISEDGMSMADAVDFGLGVQPGLFLSLDAAKAKTWEYVVQLINEQREMVAEDGQDVAIYTGEANLFEWVEQPETEHTWRLFDAAFDFEDCVYYVRIVEREVD